MKDKELLRNVKQMYNCKGCGIKKYLKTELCVGCLFELMMKKGVQND